MRHALADLEGGVRVTGVATPLKIQKLKKVIKQKTKKKQTKNPPEEMKREKEKYRKCSTFI